MPWLAVLRYLPSGLTARIIGFLSLALVPLGAIAFVQTSQLAEETRLRTQLDITALTASAVAEQHAAIVRAGGMARAFGVASSYLLDDAKVCSAFAKSFLERHPEYAFAGILTPDGNMDCASTSNSVNFSDFDGFDALMENPSSNITVNPNAAISNRSVVIVSEPFDVDGTFSGYATLSLPSENLRFTENVIRQTDMVELILFSSSGYILGTQGEPESFAQVLPAGFELADHAKAQVQAFVQRGADGAERVFNIAPILGDEIFALSVWPLQSTARGILPANPFAGLLPLLMWAASVLVAFLAVDRMVIRPIRLLGRRMRRFAMSRQFWTGTSPEWMSQELRDMENDFAAMAESIIRDEAAQEDALREKTILLKEVHHRVKNNLQLISSIMNMQIRRAETEETQAVLTGLQDRVRSLATIYRRIYETNNLGHIDTAQLLRDVIDQTVLAHRTDVSSRPEAELTPVELYPDQAVPLTLLLAESLANALEFTPRPEGRISIRFGPDDDGFARIEIVNDIGADHVPGTSGLGSRLIRAFAVQLGGRLEIDTDEWKYRVAVLFHISDFKPEVKDY